MTFDAPVSRGIEGNALRTALDEYRTKKQRPPLFALMHYEKCRLILQPLAVFGKDGPEQLMLSQEKVDLVSGGYDDFNRGNVEGVIARFHPEIEWIEPGGGNAPSGTFKGPESVADQVFATLPSARAVETSASRSSRRSDRARSRTAVKAATASPSKYPCGMGG